MNLLAIDTSTKNFSLAAARDEKILAHKDIFLEKVLSDSIIPSIDALLKKAKIPLAKIDGFVVGLGPGSFTSLRVGLSTIKALALTTQKPVVGISSLDAIAMGAVQKDATICVMSDARRNLIYTCCYQKQNGQLKRLTDYDLLDTKAFIKVIKKDMVCVGDAIPLLKAEIEKVLKGKIIFADEKLWHPQAQNLIPLALPRFRSKKFDNIAKLVPLYLYPEDCQVVR